MVERLFHLSPMLRIGLVACSGLALVAAGAMLAAGVPRGAAVGEATVPPIDRQIPTRVETATLAMG